MVVGDCEYDKDAGSEADVERIRICSFCSSQLVSYVCCCATIVQGCAVVLTSMSAGSTDEQY